MAPSSISTLIRFREFDLHLAENSLYKNGERIRLTPKEFLTLRILVEKKGEVVTKDVLLHEVWPDTFVGETSLTRNISVLRKVLGDGVIETVPKLGYRFIASINESLRKSSAVTQTSDAPLVMPLDAIPDTSEAASPISQWASSLSVQSTVAFLIVILATAVISIAVSRVQSHRTIRSVVVLSSAVPENDVAAEILAGGMLESSLHALGRVTSVKNVAQHTPVLPDQAATAAKELKTDAARLLITESRGERLSVRIEFTNQDGRSIWNEIVTGRVPKWDGLTRK